ncbi:hypothetical protein P154DRAFT_624862 [Amniculicola lignicola CBS 123094]|uniref:Uncharacterized protein n=1 Tax=Amniculicola lignicola CBS 123094 TaxID=1392246 RepID=A0A6A5W239_9PLEO|nr:hypothetical protein P154DRAFT_624862 [Amniculicola lignicola CBS 123094]
MFAIQVGRIAFYIVSDPRHVATFYHETKTLPFDYFLSKTITGFGISSEGVKKTFAPSLPEGRKSTKHVRVVYLYTTHKVGFARFGKKMQASWPFKTWTTETVIHVLQDVYFGDELAKIEPDMPHILAEFGKEQRRSTSYFTQSLGNERRVIGLEHEDRLSLMLFMYWGYTSNITSSETITMSLTLSDSTIVLLWSTFQVFVLSVEGSAFEYADGKVHNAEARKEHLCSYITRLLIPAFVVTSLELAAACFT